MTASAKAIKEAIWNGWYYSWIAETFGISLAQVSRVASGRYYRDVEWPDGTKGQLSSERRRQIRDERRAAILKAFKETGGLSDQRGEA